MAALIPSISRGTHVPIPIGVPGQGRRPGSVDGWDRRCQTSPASFLPLAVGHSTICPDARHDTAGERPVSAWAQDNTGNSVPQGSVRIDAPACDRSDAMGDRTGRSASARPSGMVEGKGGSAPCAEPTPPARLRGTREAPERRLRARPLYSASARSRHGLNWRLGRSHPRAEWRSSSASALAATTE
jgi:hypothetical protein